MAKSVCKTNIRKALRRSIDTNHYESVNDEWNVYDLGSRVELWNHVTGKSLYTNHILCCESMSEYVDFATELILKEYELLDEWERSSKAQDEHDKVVHPWDYLEDDAEYNAYENAYDYFVYGEGFRSWVERGHDCGIDPERRKYIWSIAFWSCADGEAPKDPVEAYERLCS